MKRVAALLVLVAGVAAAAEPPPARTLFIMLDAVPFSVVEELAAPERGEAALFRGFQAPVPVISTFPSSTSVAAAGLLEPAGLERSPGYEARFYDWDEGRVRGGGPLSYYRIDFPWRRFFDWNRSGVVRSAVNALRPLRAARRRLDAGIHGFFASNAPDYWVYVEFTDVVAHLDGPPALAAVLAYLDQRLQDARRRHPQADYRVVVFSDHGVAGVGEPLVNVWRPVRRALVDGGFRVRKRVQTANDVALTPFGLVSSFEVYALPERRPALAASLARVDGVDLCVHPAAEGWRVHGDAGVASFGKRTAADGVQWLYTPEGDDPLGYGELAGRWRADDEWLTATASHRYPDALYRMARAFDLVLNPASIVCSLEPGHMFGRKSTERAARLTGSRLRWTHGALSREATNGFLLTDDRGWKGGAALRFDRALLPFLDGFDKMNGSPAPREP